MNLISSKTETSRKLSMNQLTGKVTNDIKNLRQELVEIISHIEVNIDYPEYEDIEEMTNEKILPNLLNFRKKIQEIIKIKTENITIKRI